MIDENMKIAELIKEYPFLLNELAKRNTVLKNLQNPIVYNTIGKIAKLKDVSKNSGENLDDLIAFIEEQIKRRES